MTWNYRFIKRIDFRVLPIILCLMLISLTVISSYTAEDNPVYYQGFFTSYVKKQMQYFLLGICVFFFFTSIDYNKIREATWFLYLLMLLALMGVFFTGSINKVHRWYRIPFVNFNFQPSEYAKLVVVISLSWFIEKRKGLTHLPSTAFWGCLIVGIPFLLILKQPDLGTALVLYPITSVIFYLGGVYPRFVKFLSCLGGVGLTVVCVIFLGFLPHNEIRPIATLILKDYQFDRFDPNTHHQRASLTAIATGGFTGKGWRESDYTAGGWLPEPHTDSVFPAFGEEFGFLGLLFLIFLFYCLIYFSFQVTAVAKDDFGRLLSGGLSVYLASHILCNIGMMCGILPITGFPLILVTYGGSSIIATMAALGILQSIYSRRFMF